MAILRGLYVSEIFKVYNVISIQVSFFYPTISLIFFGANKKMEFLRHKLCMKRVKYSIFDLL